MNKFDKIYNEAIESLNQEVKTFVKKRFKKHAVKVERDGYVMTREGKATYKAGDYIAFDKQGGQYPISKAEFDNLYEPTDNPEYWISKPVEVKMFKTDKEIEIQTPWGLLIADPGDWVEVKSDGSYGAPRKPDVIKTDYDEKA